MVLTLDRKTAEEETAPGQKSVLHVEYDEDWRKLIGWYLKEAGYRDVVQTDNLADAKSEIERKKYDLYISEGSFPLRRGGRSVPVGGDLYKFVKDTQGNFNYVFISHYNPLVGLMPVSEEVRFFDKGNFNARTLVEYLKNIQ